MDRNYTHDVISSVLFFAAAGGLGGLFAFIARARLDASVQWVGIIGAAGYTGYLWNLLFSRLTSRISLRRGIVTTMALGGVILGIGAFQHSLWPYCLAVIAFLLAWGLGEVQYNTLISDMYPADQRPRKLSRRYFAISIAAAGAAVLFGHLSSGEHGHTVAFLVGGVMAGAGAWVFSGIRTEQEHHMEPFNPLDVLRTVVHTPRFGRTAAVLILYGWTGAGLATLLVLVYQASGLQEQQVGQLAAVRAVGALFALLAITPRLHFAGTITNFKYTFLAALGTSIICLGVVAAAPKDWALPMLGLAEFLFGISSAVFAIAIQTTGLNLAEGDKVTLYVNALMIVQGARGIIMPLLTALVVQVSGLQTAMVITVTVSLLCVAVVLIPGIDHAQPQKAVTCPR